MTDSYPLDPHADDPFFKRGANTNWNACIGNQGHEANYIDGYIEAAIELVEAVITKELVAQRDTLVLPILYNARHGLELVLKFATERMIKADLIKGDGYHRNHDIAALWERLEKASLGDRRIVDTIAALKPFVQSLSAIDDDGQELRYHENREKAKSLAAYSISNLEIIRESLAQLKCLVDDLKWRTWDLVEEKTRGTTTKACSRADLMKIAQMLPSRDQWGTNEFSVARATVCAKYGLSSRRFSEALNAITSSRELAAVIGIESPLLHISDDEIVRTVVLWRRLNPSKPYDPNDLGLNFNDPARFSEEALEKRRREREFEVAIVNEIENGLSPQALAELEAMYDFGRQPTFGEEHGENLSRVQKEHTAAGDTRRQITRLMEKTNFLRCLQVAAPRLGRLDLAKRLQD